MSKTLLIVAIVFLSIAVGGLWSLNQYHVDMWQVAVSQTEDLQEQISTSSHVNYNCEARVFDNNQSAIKKCDTRMAEYRMNVCNPRVERAHEAGVESGICAYVEQSGRQSFEMCMLDWDLK